MKILNLTRRAARPVECRSYLGGVWIKPAQLHIESLRVLGELATGVAQAEDADLQAFDRATIDPIKIAVGRIVEPLVRFVSPPAGFDKVNLGAEVAHDGKKQRHSPTAQRHGRAVVPVGHENASFEHLV